MLNFKIFGRKELPGLDEDIDPEELNEPDDKAVIEHLRDELEQFKQEQKKSPQEEVIEKKKIPQFLSISGIIGYLEESSDGSFKAHEVPLRKEIVSFLEKAMPDSAISFEISLLKERQAILEKLKGAREIYGDISIKKESRSQGKKLAQSSKDEKEPEPNQKDNEPEEKPRSFDWANNVLKPVPESHELKIGEHEISGFEDFYAFVSSMPEHDFNIHLLPMPKRKGIASWLEHVVGYEELARKIVNCSTRKEIVELVTDSFASVKQKARVGSKSLEPAEEEPKTEEAPAKAKEEPVFVPPEKPEPGEKPMQAKKPLTILSSPEPEKQETSEEEKPKPKKRLGLFKKKKEILEEEKKNEQEEAPVVLSPAAIYDKLHSIDKGEFLQKKAEFVSVVASGENEKEEQLFKNADSKERFLELLEKMLYNRSEFEKELNKINISASVSDEGLHKMPGEEEAGEEQPEPPEPEGVKEQETERKKEGKALDMAKEKPEEETTQEPKKEKAGEKEAEPHVKDDSLALGKKKKKWALFNRERAKEKAISSRESQNEEEEDGAFFKDASKLKQELRGIKYESIVDLPPPEKVGLEEAKDRMFELVRPDIHSDAPFAKPSDLAEIFDDSYALENSVKEKQARPEPPSHTEEDSITREQLSLLEKELELVRKKRDILSGKAKKEKEALERFNRAIRKQEEVLESLAEVAKYSPEKQPEPPEIQKEEKPAEESASKFEKILENVPAPPEQKPEHKKEQKLDSALLNELDKLLEKSEDKPEPKAEMEEPINEQKAQKKPEEPKAEVVPEQQEMPKKEEIQKALEQFSQEPKEEKTSETYVSQKSPEDLSVEDVMNTINTYLATDKLDEVSDLIKKAKKLVKAKSKKAKEEMLDQINANIESRKQLIS